MKGKQIYQRPGPARNWWGNWTLLEMWPEYVLYLIHRPCEKFPYEENIPKTIFDCAILGVLEFNLSKALLSDVGCFSTVLVVEIILPTSCEVPSINWRDIFSNTSNLFPESKVNHGFTLKCTNHKWYNWSKYLCHFNVHLTWRNKKALLILVTSTAALSCVAHSTLCFFTEPNSTLWKPQYHKQQSGG